MIARGYHWHLLCSSEIQKKGKEMFKISNDSTELKVAADFFTDAQLAYIWRVKQATEFAEGLRLTPKPKNNVKTKKVSQIN
jgi:hypothetical protein